MDRNEKRIQKEQEEFRKYQQMVIEREAKMSNQELLDEVIWAAQGDDYDGCFTTRGEWEFEYLKGKLYARLQGWLESPAPQ